MKNPFVKTTLIILAFAVIASIIWEQYRPATAEIPAVGVTQPITDSTAAPQQDDFSTTSMCYYRSTKSTVKTAVGLYDKAWLTLNIKGQNVTGEYHNFPAEKDATEGTFTGTTTADSTMPTASQVANAWLTSNSEGMNNKSELLFVYDPTTASVGFGEMVASPADANTYLYQDETKLTYDVPIPAINCDSLTQITTVEKYAKDNISTIIGTKDTLTPSVAPQTASVWSVISANVEIATHTAEITYTDGHVTHKGDIAYTYDTEGNLVTVTNFIKI